MEEEVKDIWRDLMLYGKVAITLADGRLIGHIVIDGPEKLRFIEADGTITN